MRADMTASWLAQMGWEAFVLDGLPASALTEAGASAPRTPAAPPVQGIGPLELAELLKLGQATVLDFGPSPRYRKSHIPGAAFVIRSDLRAALEGLPPEGSRTLVLVSADGTLAAFATPEVEAITGRRPRVLEGGLSAWTRADLPLDAGDGVALSPFEDVYRRPYEGADNPVDAMQAYLDWEFGLVAQLERDASHGFFVIQS